MENYGRIIIAIYLVNGQTALQYLMNVSKKIQANSDRSDIRVFETGISPQRHGNIRQSSRAAEEEECNRLRTLTRLQHQSRQIQT